MKRHVMLFVFVAALVSAAVNEPAAQSAAAPTEQGLLAKGAKKLGAKDFETLYVGNTLSGTTSDNEPFHVFVETGAAYRMLFQGKRITDKWHVGKDGEFCSVADGETTCTREYTHEQTIYSFNTDGTYAGTAKLRPGNPEKL